MQNASMKTRGYCKWFRFSWGWEVEMMMIGLGCRRCCKATSQHHRWEHTTVLQQRRRQSNVLADPSDIGRQELDLLHSLDGLQPTSRADHGDRPLNNGHDDRTVLLVRWHWGRRLTRLLALALGGGSRLLLLIGSSSDEGGMGLDEAHLDGPSTGCETSTTNAALIVNNTFTQFRSKELTATVDESVDALQRVPLNDEGDLGVKQLQGNGGEAVGHGQAEAVSKDVDGHIPR